MYCPDTVTILDRDTHAEFAKHLLRYFKMSKADRLKFKTHDGPKDIKTMTEFLQLRFQCDADLAGNLDNLHSQTSYLGYLGPSLICWCSTYQSSIPTSTAESEIKAVNHTIKAEVIANHGMLSQMGWFMLDHGFDELVEDETLIVQLGRLAQLEILSDGLD